MTSFKMTSTRLALTLGLVLAAASAPALARGNGGNGGNGGGNSGASNGGEGGSVMAATATAPNAVNARRAPRGRISAIPAPHMPCGGYTGETARLCRYDN
ncbi:MAG: hypothetical protein FD175_1200 [Beijerinckiaceae bacterium]|nr:MAG: hypothetical protein FD175_1200 [Beijerinckiaceae bacterium]